MRNYHYYRDFTQSFKENNDNNIFWTIIAGVFVFILSQIILEFFLKPFREYKNIKNEVFNKLKLYSNIITNPISKEDFIINKSRFSFILSLNAEEEQEFEKMNNQRIFENYLNISSEIRKLSCDLEVKYYDNYNFIRKLFIKEKNKNIDDAVFCLIRISNSLFDNSRAVANSDDIDNIKKYLNLNK